MADHDEPSVTYLVSTLKADLSEMVADQIALAKAEMKGSARHGGIGVGALGGALVLLALAGIVLSFALAEGVSGAFGIAIGWGLFIVGGAYLLLALLMAGVGAQQLKKVQPPTRTIAALRNTPRALTNRPSPPT